MSVCSSHTVPIFSSCHSTDQMGGSLFFAHTGFYTFVISASRFKTISKMTFLVFTPAPLKTRKKNILFMFCTGLFVQMIFRSEF